MMFAEHQLSFRQRRRLRLAGVATLVFAAASLAGAHDALVTASALGALAATWRLWQARHDDPRDGWTA